jgi:hypothetical protein
MKETPIVFTVTTQEANMILGALQELPFKTSAALIQKLMLQGRQQQESVAQAGQPPSAEEPERRREARKSAH